MKGSKKFVVNSSARSADKKGLPRGTEGEDDYAYREYLPSNRSPGDPRIASRYGESERENNERVNRNDPEKMRKSVEDVQGSILHTFKAPREKNEREEKFSARRITQTKKAPTPFTKSGEYPCEVVRIDDFENAIIKLQDGKEGIIYKGKRRGLTKGAELEVLFARVNPKGKPVFELPKNPQKLLADYYDIYAKGMTRGETVKQLFSLYGSKNVKEGLKGVLNEKVLESIWEEYKNAA